VPSPAYTVEVRVTWDEGKNLIAIGPIARGLVLVVWTEADDETIRIISARLATERERALYHRYMDERL
jgi:uncharacterized DUF497 family protein